MYTGLYSAKDDCLLCGDVITNPLCFNCVEAEIKEWLTERMPRLIPKLRKTSELFASYTHKATTCILCGTNMNTCTHCYCSEVKKLFKDYPRLDEEFVEFFNFELKGSSRVNALEDDF